MEATFKPQVNGDLDTQNFMKFDEVECPKPTRTGFGPIRKMLLTPKDLNFVGYTYKHFEAVKGFHHSFGVKGTAPQRQSSTDSFHSDSGVDYSSNDTETRML